MKTESTSHRRNITLIIALHWITDVFHQWHKLHRIMYLYYILECQDVFSQLHLSNVAVPEWSKELASFLCTFSAESLGLSPAIAHIDRSHWLWTATLGTGRSILSCNVWADSARYVSNCSKWVAALIKGSKDKHGDGEEISFTITKLSYWKAVGVKSCCSPMTVGGYGTSLTLFGDRQAVASRAVFVIISRLDVQKRLWSHLNNSETE